LLKVIHISNKHLCTDQTWFNIQSLIEYIKWKIIYIGRYEIKIEEKITTNVEKSSFQDLGNRLFSLLTKCTQLFITNNHVVYSGQVEMCIDIINKYLKQTKHQYSFSSMRLSADSEHASRLCKTVCVRPSV